MFKILLPNPFEMSIPEFITQMRIVLKSVEKSYEAMEKARKENNRGDEIYLMFRTSREIENLLEKQTITNEHGKETNAYDEWSGEQELYLEINQP